jgi:hypothetical protein
MSLLRRFPWRRRRLNIDIADTPTFVIRDITRLRVPFTGTPRSLVAQTLTNINVCHWPTGMMSYFPKVN